MVRTPRMQTLGTNPAEIGFQPPIGQDRRRRVRHKVQLPAYVSLGEKANEGALDLSEIINLSEDGMAIQTSSPLKVNQRATFVLDLPETSASIRTDGKVVWAGSSGRVGIKFAGMPRDLNFELKKWLFANAVAGWVKRAADKPESADAAAEKGAESPASTSKTEHLEAPSRPDHTVILTALEAVKRETEALGTDLDAALDLIVRRAQTFTHADSAAIALTEGQDMVCRATFGPSAPSPGVHFKAGSGFSGECVRTGLLLRCDDSETDPRVDRDSCRFLGIRSMLAAPIRWEPSVIGLIEVFSAEAHAFNSEAEMVIARLAETISEAVHRAGSPDENLPSQEPADEELPRKFSALNLQKFCRFRNVLLFAAVLTVIFVILWLIGTWGNTGLHIAATPTSADAKLSIASPNSSSIAMDNFEALRRLADEGDPTAQFAIGARYATGEDVPQDYAEAVRWFKKAAEQGQVAAQATLGAYYWAGRGVAPDLNQAYFWSFLAEAGGDEASRSRVALLASRLNRAQILAAQKQANDWFKSHQMAAKPSPEIR